MQTFVKSEIAASSSLWNAKAVPLPISASGYVGSCSSICVLGRREEAP